MGNVLFVAIEDIDGYVRDRDTACAGQGFGDALDQSALFFKRTLEGMHLYKHPFFWSFWPHPSRVPIVLIGEFRDIDSDDIGLDFVDRTDCLG